MQRDTREQAQLQRNAFFHGNKRSVYDNLQSHFYLEEYTHPMMTRVYLKRLFEGKIVCPERNHFRDTDASLKLPKRLLCSLLLNTGQDFFLRPQSLPSTSWMLAALRMCAPNHPLVALADQAFNLNQQFLIDQVTTEEFLAAKAQNIAQIALYVENERTTWQNTWDEFIRDQIIDAVAELILANRHFIATDELNEIMRI